jgi:hypothetical protein
VPLGGEVCAIPPVCVPGWVSGPAGGWVGGVVTAGGVVAGGVVTSGGIVGVDAALTSVGVGGALGVLTPGAAGAAGGDVTSGAAGVAGGVVTAGGMVAAGGAVSVLDPVSAEGGVAAGGRVGVVLIRVTSASGGAGRCGRSTVCASSAALGIALLAGRRMRVLSASSSDGDTGAGGTG